jgi:hypothetical protein
MEIQREGEAMNIITELPKGALTLRAATEGDRIAAAAVFPLWESVTDGRFVIQPTFSYNNKVMGDVVLHDNWRTYGTVEGVAVELRRADCGAGCRCAGEFKFRDPM